MTDNEEIMHSKFEKVLKTSHLPWFLFGIPMHKPYIG
jgi:hypothetical protein